MTGSRRRSSASTRPVRGSTERARSGISYCAKVWLLPGAPWSAWWPPWRRRAFGVAIGRSPRSATRKLRARWTRSTASSASNGPTHCGWSNSPTCTLGRVLLRGLRDRRLCPPDRGREGQYVGPRRLRPRPLGSIHPCPQARTATWPGPPQRQGRSLPWNELYAAPGRGQPRAIGGIFGDGYDNALAETINGLYKTEVIWRQRSWPSASAVKMATLRWVDWRKNQRLFSPIGYIPPAEAEANYHAAKETLDMVA